MPISEETIRKVKEVADILDVIGDFVVLKKKGQNWFGLSPFSQEKTPSFSVSPSRGIFKDFSSGKAGDSISFLMEHEGLGYIEAIKYLANKYGIEIEETERSPEDVQKQNEIESLYILLNFAKKFYQDKLWETDEGKTIGLSYFKERGFLEKTVQDFELGYSLEDWTAFLEYAKKNQYDESLLEKAGLIIQKEDKTYDRFRARVIFPIHNLIGKVVGFGARMLGNDKKQPKYINSPETAVYNKSKELYGFYFAKNQIRNDDSCILVEGYTDVISLHQAGVKNVISSSGTALTEDQIKVIKRFTNNLILLFDGDAAGQRAAERGVRIALKAGMNLHVIVLPDNQDPDSFVLEIGGEAFIDYIAKEKQDFLSFKTRQGLDEIQGDPIKKASLIKEIVEIIGIIPDAITRSVYFKACSEILDIDEQVLVSEYNKGVYKERFKQSNTTSPKSRRNLNSEVETSREIEGIIDLEKFKHSDHLHKEREILRSLLNFANVKIEPDNIVLGNYLLESIADVEFKNPEFSSILGVFKQFMNSGSYPDVNDFLGNEELIDFKSTVIDIISDKYSVSENWSKHNIYVPTDEDKLMDKVYTDIYRLKWQRIKELKQSTLEEIKGLDPERTPKEDWDKLQRKFFELKKIEKKISEELGNVIS